MSEAKKILEVSETHGNFIICQKLIQKFSQITNVYIFASCLPLFLRTNDYFK